MSYTTTPPSDASFFYYDWVKYADGPTMVRFFNDLALRHGDLGFQERLSVSGSNERATFMFSFEERSVQDDLPAISIYLTRAFIEGDNLGPLTARVVRPERLSDETHVSLTTRWLNTAYDILVEFNESTDAGFVFSQDYPGTPLSVPGFSNPSDSTPLTKPWFPTALSSWTAETIPDHVTLNGAAISANGVLLSSPSDPIPDDGQSFVALQYLVKDWTDAAQLLEAGATSRDKDFVLLLPYSTGDVIPAMSAWLRSVSYFGELTVNEQELVRNNPV